MGDIKVFDEIPRLTCNPSMPFLEDNDEFFLINVFLFEKVKNWQKYAPRIIRHLNSCFWCFEAYTQVMRDYYITSQKLLNMENEQSFEIKTLI
jgi:hypothetical protein